MVSLPHSLTLIPIAFIVDTGKECFVWIGKETTQNEKRQAMSFAHVSLKSTLGSEESQ